MSTTPLQTEFEFTLPKGYVDDEGTVHKEGRMRLATAADEIKPLNDLRVQENASYLTIILLSRVITDLGSLERVDTDVIESLFVSDLTYLQELYERVNDGGTEFADVMERPPAEGVENPEPDDAMESLEADTPADSPTPDEVEEGNGPDA